MTDSRTSAILAVRTGSAGQPSSASGGVAALGALVETGGACAAPHFGQSLADSGTAAKPFLQALICSELSATVVYAIKDAINIRWESIGRAGTSRPPVHPADQPST